MTEKVPILFLIFNRPKSTESVFNKIREYQPERLYIACDGPRASKLGEASIVDKTKKIVESLIDWKCEIKTLYRESNLGCKEAVRSAIDWFFENEEMGIILEDDCVPHLDFFDYCSKMLLEYQYEERVMLVSGSNFVNRYRSIRKHIKKDYFFSRYVFIWGWATWRRAWELYDRNMDLYEEFRSSNRITEIFHNKEEQQFWMNSFDSVYAGRLDTWDYQWVFTCYYNNGLSIIPSKNLISNIGFGIEGNTHGDSDEASKNMNLKTYPFEILDKPKKISNILLIDDQIYKRIFDIREKDSIIKKNVRRIIRKLKLLKKIRWAIKGELQKKDEIPQVVSFPHDNNVPLKGYALVSYLKNYLTYPDDHEVFNSHSNKWESKKIVEIIASQGYDVDVIDYNNFSFKPKKKYDLVFDIHYNIDRLAYSFKPNCIKIMHLTGNYPDYSNQKELSRVNDLVRRKGKHYSPKRIIDTIYYSRSLKLADKCSLIGTERTKSFYPLEYQDKIDLVPVTSSNVDMKKYNKKFSREFLWFYGSGAVHKGLDILLDLFSKNSHYCLNIVGDIEDESDFFEIYNHEIYDLENIRYYGRLSTKSEEFKEIIDRSFCFIAPSCSESISTACVTCLQIGLFPIISIENGIVLKDQNHILLKSNSENEIYNAIEQVYQYSDNKIIEAIKENRDYATNNYSRKKFIESMTEIVKS